MIVCLTLKDALLHKLCKVCIAGVQSLAHNSEHKVKEGGFLYSAAIWVKRQILTPALDIKR